MDNILDVMADFLIEEAKLAFSSDTVGPSDDEKNNHLLHRFSLESSKPLQKPIEDHLNGLKDKSIHRSNSFSNSMADVDSGIDTSDSCDEKKNKPSHKCLKKQYSKS